jgi:hypothetical protein
MTETLQEFCDWHGAAVRVDRAAGVVRGVKILGLRSRNGRSYLPEALAEAAALYEDAKVNVNHAKGQPGTARDYQDRIGVIRNVAARPGEGLFADFHFNPKHALAEQLAWDAEHAPQNVGFSHNVEARTARRGDQVVVEAITRVQSVDLVADPATTAGLFESRGQGQPAAGTLTVESLNRDWPELFEAITHEQADEVQRLQAEVERLTAQEAARQKRETVRRLLREYQLPDPEADPQARPITSQRFLESLMAAADEPAIRVLIEERAALVRSLSGAAPQPAPGKPVSRDQYLVDTPSRLDAKAFADAIT